MKKTIFIVMAAAVLPFLFNGCGGGSTPRSEIDSVSYAVGINLGTQMKDDTILNIDLVLSGIHAAFNGKNNWTAEEAVAFLREYYNIRLPQRAREAGEAYLKDVEATNPNVRKTDSGLLYEIIEPGDMDAKPNDTRDRVKVTYEGKLKDGKVFDSSYERNDTAEFALNRVVKGWGEGLQLVGKGGKIKLYIPSDLGYGPTGSRSPTGEMVIGPHEPLVFDVELIDVIPFEEPAAN
ncbi:MAG: FKBP-type peptidyl-prolyl cis-trans isomerase [Alistipes sp.]|nr:FKBP-type peptidyl-prolyl cis-trans isomerase [Alistipes sp.]